MVLASIGMRYSGNYSWFTFLLEVRVSFFFFQFFNYFYRLSEPGEWE
jgi:hypothetical protein